MLFVCVCVYIYLLIYGNKNSTELLFIHKCTLDTFSLGFPDGSVGKESAYNAGDVGFPWVGKFPWRREWQPTPVFLPGEFHEHRSLVDYSPWDWKELDTAE